MLRRLPNRLGEHPARTSGEGIEFFGVREYVPGDRQRSINWAASTRRGRLQVNTFAAERSQDVVLLVDPTSDVGQPGSSALDLALRGAGQRPARTCVQPAARPAVRRGAAGHARARLQHARRRRAEHRAAGQAADRLAGGSGGVVPPASTDRLARRLWRMEQDAIRFSLRELGIPVVHWDGEEPLDLPLATLRPQARVLGLGAALLALGAGAGMLPAAGPGAGSALLRLVAAGALIAAAGLVLPFVARRLPFLVTKR